MNIMLTIANKPKTLCDALKRMNIQQLHSIESYPVAGLIGMHRFRIVADGVTLIRECEVVDEFAGMMKAGAEQTERSEG